MSEREVGVLRLMAMGRNNREIAQVLGISPNTVSNHIRNILQKTSTANRTEAAAFANREGLPQGVIRQVRANAALNAGGYSG